MRIVLILIRETVFLSRAKRQATAARIDGRLCPSVWVAGAILSVEMHRRSALRGLPVAGIAVVGVVLGHWLGYLLAVPDPHLRAEILARSGHGYWMVAIKAAVVLGFASLGSVLLRHLRARTHGERPIEDRPAMLAFELASLQVSAFMAMEAIERLVVGESLAQLFQHHLFLLGVALQVAVACIGALLLLWFNRVAHRVCRSISRPQLRRSPAGHPPPVFVLALPPHVLSGGTGLRSPPSR